MIKASYTEKKRTDRLSANRNTMQLLLVYYYYCEHCAYEIDLNYDNKISLHSLFTSAAILESQIFIIVCY